MITVAGATLFPETLLLLRQIAHYDEVEDCWEIYIPIKSPSILIETIELTVSCQVEIGCQIANWFEEQEGITYDGVVFNVGTIGVNGIRVGQG